MKKLSFEITTTLQFSQPVVEHYFLLRTIPLSFEGQHIVHATLTLTPDIPYTLQYDGFGNLNETGCIRFPHETFTYSISGLAEINESRRMSEPLLSIYKYPSYYTGVSKEMKSYLYSLHLEGSILEKAQTLADAIFHDMAYLPGTTSTATTAMEAFAMKQGVCQDYAHIFIALCRYIGIPARYANGLPLGTGPSHAWAEIYADGIWVGIDPTHNRFTCEDYVRFCVGRDFHDCALERGTLIGNALQSQTISGQVSEQ